MTIYDSLDNEFSSIEEMWKRELDEETVLREKLNPKEFPGDLLIGHRIGSKKAWYRLGEEYWDEQEATVDGVLGGYEKYHEMESNYSNAVLK